MADNGGAAAVPRAERIDVLDALRGFALLGVFVANMHSFSGWIVMTPAQQVALAGQPWRDLSGFLFLLLVDGKFYTIFSLLFGAGFALQLHRLERRTAHGGRLFARRMMGLLGIGLVHLLCIWFGDILTLYALSGFVLLAVRGWSDRRLLGVAAALIVLPVPGAALVHALGLRADFGLFALSDAVAAATGHDVGDFLSWIRAPDWKSFADWQASGVLYRLGYLLASWRPAKVIAIMMIGLWAGRRLVDGSLMADRARLKRVLVWGLVLGLPGNLLVAWLGGINGAWGWRTALAETGYALGVVPLALAYAAAFVLAWPRASRWLGEFAPAGRMALTNYLAQSVIGVALFHGVGLGLAGRLAPGGLVLLAVGIFAAQACASRLWLARFGQGPMERLWRWMTYGAAR